MPIVVGIVSVAAIVLLFMLVSMRALTLHSAFSGAFTVVGLTLLVIAAGLSRGWFERGSAGDQSARGLALRGVGFLLVAGLLAPFWSLPVWVKASGLIVFLVVFWSGLRLDRRARQQQVAAQVPHHG